MSASDLPPIPPGQMISFIELSSLLTGFAAGVIAPTLDPTDLKSVLFRCANERSGPVFVQVLSAFDGLVAQYAPGLAVSEMSAAQLQSIGDGILGVPPATQDAQVSACARAVMKAWYLGSWYQPFDVTAGGRTFAAGSQFVISDRAYTMGLAWQVAQAHAMGFSTATFGYWSSPPAASLQQITTGVAPTSSTSTSTTGTGGAS